MQKKTFSESKYKKFFDYFEYYWKTKSKHDKIKYIPDWNYYYIIKSIDFDIKYLFITNNIAEHNNKILNSHLKTKYPLFEIWKNAILKN